jgi:hypothetical protein
VDRTLLTEAPMQVRKNLAAALVALAVLGCSAGSAPPIDRSGFGLNACPSGAASPFDGLTPTTPVDYLALREGSSVIASRGTLCAGAGDAAACRDRVNGATNDGWPSGPSGGAAAPDNFIVFVRGDTVATVGAASLGAFLAPIENPFDAAFVAQVATLGPAGCTRPSVRAVDGGFEVLTATTQPCGGAQTEQRVFVATDGTATIRETRAVRPASGTEICP